MELIQIYDRAVGQWSERYRLQVGFSENWVQDKTTDTGKDFVFRVKGAAEPKWGITDWVRVLHVTDEAEPATYTEEGLPDNHTQYIIGAIECKQNKLLNKWVVTLSLIEPIERTQGILGETLSYTNQTSKTVKVNDVDVTYVKEPYNHYTALRRWLMVTPANCDVYDENLTRSESNKSWYNRITVLDKDWLATIPFNDTTYNELSLYNVLMDNYDSSVGRTPVMYFDIDPATDLPRVNARDEYLLKFERQDGFDKPVLDYDELTDKAMNISITKSANNYATGLVSNITNLSAGTPVEYPALNLYAVPEAIDDLIRDTSKVPYNAAGDNWVIRFPHRLKRITKVTEMEFQGTLYDPLSSQKSSIKRTNVLKTHLVFERKQYISEQPSPDGNNDIMWYEEGSDLLHIKYYFKSTTDDKTSIFYIEYEPLIDCRVVVGDESFVQQVNQSSSQVDAGKFAGFMQSYLNGMNKADRIFGKTYYSFDAFKDHIGCRVKRGDKTYLITNVSYRNRNLQYDVFYQLNEHHLRKNASYQASQEVRPNVEIATGNIKERKSYIQQTVRVGTTAQVADGNQFLAYKEAAVAALINRTAEVPASKYPQVALIKTSSKLKTSGGATQSYGQYQIANITRCAFGDRVVFNVRFKDNAVAAIKKLKIVGRSDASPNGYFWFMDVGEQRPILYSDYFGEVQQIDLKLCALSDSGLPDLPYTEDGHLAIKPEFDKTRKVYETMANLPEISDTYRADLESGEILGIYGLNAYNDMLEGFNLNIGIKYEGEENAIVCPGLLSNSRLIKAAYVSGSVLALYTYNREMNIGDDFSADRRQDFPSTISYSNGRISYTGLTAGALGADYKSLVIAVKQGSTDIPLIIINNPSATVRNDIANRRLYIYFA